MLEQKELFLKIILRVILSGNTKLNNKRIRNEQNRTIQHTYGNFK